MFEQLRTIPLLILDDLGAESPTPWANEKLYQLFNHRYTHRLPTVITTNVELDRLDPRIRSRLVDRDLTRIVSMNLPDFRRGDPEQTQSDLSNLRFYAHMTFENFEVRQDALTPELVSNLQQALYLAQEFAMKPDKWLVLLGPHGSGKTHLAAAIANYRLRHSEIALFVTTADLLDYLRAAYNPAARTSLDQRFQEVRSTPLLILDHFQLETATPWAQEKLFQIIDYRYLSSLPTVITKYGDDLDGLDYGFRSRLADRRLCQLFCIKAPDYRGGVSARRGSR
jgi:DNA replication protein DnaC